jgi:7,8-dihydro-6-hydroxymethylpterin-pyrophosphokinase
MEHRLFVLRPLCEIAPEYIHPRLGQTIKELLQVLEKKDSLPEVFRLTWQGS